jgi:endonuclease/exonuclease/phosphatase family metal-dependent hydrolase
VPFYTALRKALPDVSQRTAEGLLRLKKGVRDEGIPDHALDDRVLIATWNIREFDSSKGGRRGIEPLLCIAEVISAFDIVAVQEVREDLAPLTTLLQYLGPWWHVLVTDVTRGTQGNFERLAFLYDTRKVRFGGLVGEVVRPPSKKAAGQDGDFATQFARTPFLVGFQVGWLKFTICTAHILYGTANALDPRRLKEIAWLAGMLADQHLERHAWSGNVILLGDFNVFDTTDATAKAITDAGFTIPPELTAFTSNLTQTKHYDQIAFFQPQLGGVASPIVLDHAGVFHWDKYVYRSGDGPAYKAAMGKSTMAYPTWRTYQMSDHLPMWVELRTDRSLEYLERLALGAGVPAVAEGAPAIPLTQVG